MTAGLLAVALVQAAVLVGAVLADALTWRQALLAAAVAALGTGAAWLGRRPGPGIAVVPPPGSAAREAALQDAIRAEQALVRQLPDPVLVLGRDLRVLRTNDAGHRLLGPNLLAMLRHPSLRTALDRAQSEGKAQPVELGLPGQEVAASVMPLQPPLADGGCLLVILSDRTRERALDRMRADFVANASHELRTPLASLIGFIDTLRGPAADDPPAQARFLGIMAEQASRMNRLIDDLLSLSRIEMTEHRPPADAIGLSGLLHRTAASVEPLATARKVRLTIEAPGDLPEVAGDEDQLQQVVLNLLGNAIKHGREGGTVRAVLGPARSAGSARRGVALAVIDDGQGIARDHLPRLTERFYRVDKHRSRAVGGTGLGLAIVKHIVNRHRGQLRIESTEGVGTTVTVWLPLLAGEG